MSEETEEKVEEETKEAKHAEVSAEKPAEPTEESTEEKPAEKSVKEVPKAVDPSIPDKTKEKPDSRGGRVIRKPTFDKEAWKPRTDIGRKVKAGEFTDIGQILDKGLHIMEAEVVDALVENLETELLLIGQSKGKFGGGQRRIFRQTQKKTPEGNKPKFGTYAVVGNKDGYVGIGRGKAKETVPSREKAFRRAKLNIIKIRRGCGSWQCNCRTPHSIPFAVEGKVGSVKIKLMPAPKGAGLVAEKECQKIIEMAGIKDVYSLTIGQTQTKINLVSACMMALKQLMRTKVDPKYFEQLGIVEGKIEGAESET